MSFVLIAVLSILSSCYGREFQFQNNHDEQIWVAVQGNSGHPHLEGGGFPLESGQRHSIHSEDNWAGRFWGRTGCNFSSQYCDTGDCGYLLQCGGNGGLPPISLAEITLKDDGGSDFYELSLVEGYNIAISIDPLGGKGNGYLRSCSRARCTANINGECPNELRYDVDGQTVGCKSACGAFDTDEYCCRGSYSTPQECVPSDWAVNYPQFFKDRCPDAYSFDYAEQSSTFTCNAKTYLITFGSQKPLLKFINNLLPTNT